MTLFAVLDTLIAGLVVWGLAGALGLFTLSRRPKRRAPADPGLEFVFVIPALNEREVIAATVRHLLGFDRTRVVVVDDGSDDDTADCVRAVADRRVTLIRRTLPHARRGKGDALNAAFRAINANETGDRERVVVCVMDADGRLSPGALADASAAFADERVGGCQVSVRIRNRAASFWTRMQHFEFVAFTAVYQRGRERTGAVGLGGNGQFVRLSALEDLGARPWAACLTEDQDLGIRLLLKGWDNRYLPSSFVSQQGLPDARRLVKQRTRWFQGTLQCLAHVPRIVLSTKLPLRTKIDLAGSLVAPIAMLLVSPVIIAGWIWLMLSLATGNGAGGRTMASLAVTYALGFLPALLLGYAFWLDEDDVTLPEAFVTAHLFVAYAYLWLFAGWSALGRQIIGRRGWVKTARVVEAV